MIFNYKITGQTEADNEDQAVAKLVELSNDLSPRSIEVGNTTVTLRRINKIDFYRQCARWIIDGDGRFGDCQAHGKKVSANKFAIACQSAKGK